MSDWTNLSDELIHVLLVVGTVLVNTGAFVTYVRMSFRHVDEKMNGNFELLAKDINGLRHDVEKDLAGIGGKVSKHKESADRRYHNATMAMIVIANPKDEKEIVNLLMEDN